MNENLSIGTRIDHTRYGEGIIGKVNLTSYDIYFESGGKIEFLKSNQDITVIEEKPVENSLAEGLNINEFEKVLTYVLDKYGALQKEIKLGEKWEGGKLIIEPGKENIKSKEIPIEAFFHKIVMLRDRLRVLEQNINTHSKLTDEEKLDLQQYITRIYGSLTTFNILFDDKEDYFIGMKTK
ncbi:MAG: hypothetical protein KAT68_13910 [Bacteroidales bacterium]|nr:hypothetical protein [Bacteroidales bacterium]